MLPQVALCALHGASCAWDWEQCTRGFPETLLCLLLWMHQTDHRVKQHGTVPTQSEHILDKFPFKCQRCIFFSLNPVISPRIISFSILNQIRPHRVSPCKGRFKLEGMVEGSWAWGTHRAAGSLPWGNHCVISQEASLRSKRGTCSWNSSPCGKLLRKLTPCWEKVNYWGKI